MAAPSPVRVSQHAVDRWCERVDRSAPADRARRAIELAAAHAGACIAAAARAGIATFQVRLPTGVRLVIEDLVVVTILSPDMARSHRDRLPRSFHRRPLAELGAPAPGDR